MSGHGVGQRGLSMHPLCRLRESSSLAEAICEVEKTIGRGEADGGMIVQDLGRNEQRMMLPEITLSMLPQLSQSNAYCPAIPQVLAVEGFCQHGLQQNAAIHDHTSIRGRASSTDTQQAPSWPERPMVLEAMQAERLAAQALRQEREINEYLQATILAIIRHSRLPTGVPSAVASVRELANVRPYNENTHVPQHSSNNSTSVMATPDMDEPIPYAEPLLSGIDHCDGMTAQDLALAQQDFKISSQRARAQDSGIVSDCLETYINVIVMMLCCCNLPAEAVRTQHPY